MSVKVLKDQALETYYQSLFHMYGGPGWKCLMEDVGRMIETHDRVSGVANGDELWLRKGQLAMMEWLLSHQNVVEQAHASLIAEQEGTDEETPTGGAAKVVS